ncbi:MAG: hypothetical protein A2176_11880 [Spirochaetes bacterium RBG_13_51_14]|nr:MAG: hypothetical protein A2176_11880 [Spirochaetes bacterium RBG_13_51_14]
MSHLKKYQYKDSLKFNARIYLHYKFGTNKYPWPLWVFDNIKKGENLKVLEIGCGNGLLWKLNANRIPENWEIVLSDFSEGMLHDAKKVIGNSIHHISYEVVNIEDIPYEDNTYDIIIANHMLYHVPQRRKAISEIHRVLKKNGIFYATTMRSSYMKEMIEIIKDYKSKPRDGFELNPVINNFSIENGEEQLREFFDDVILKIYEDSLMINEAEPFINYVYSCNDMNQERMILNESERRGFLEFVEDKIRRNNTIIVPSDFGLFISQDII